MNIREVLINQGPTLEGWRAAHQEIARLDTVLASTQEQLAARTRQAEELTARVSQLEAEAARLDQIYAP